MRCRQCGKPCSQTGAESINVSDGTYQTTRHYRCTKCGAEYSVTDDPVKIGEES